MKIWSKFCVEFPKILLYGSRITIYGNVCKLFLKLSHQPLEHQDLSEIKNKKEGLNYWPNHLTKLPQVLMETLIIVFITYTYREAILVYFCSICLLQACYYVFKFLYSIYKYTEMRPKWKYRVNGYQKCLDKLQKTMYMIDAQAFIRSLLPISKGHFEK